MIKFNVHFFKKLPQHEKKITLSTLFTFARIALTPCIVAAMLTGYWGMACILFFIAAITDIVDGNLARWRNEKTFLGACLDPLADKILVLSCFFTLSYSSGPLFSLPSWFVFLIGLKECILIVGAFIVYKMQGHIEIQPTLLGKFTTLIQMSFILWIFACYFFGWLPTKTYYTLLGVVLLLIFVTLLQYICIGLRHITLLQQK